MTARAYWSHEDCGWTAFPAAQDALATPWSTHGLAVTPPATPKDADDLLRRRRSGPLPAQRPAVAAARADVAR
jgi:hypothetical protein